MTELSRRHLLSGAVLAATAVSLPLAARAAAPQSGQQGPGFYRFKVGNYEVTAVNDGTWYRKLDPTFVRNAELADVQKALSDAFLPTDVVPIPFTTLVVNTGSKLVALDTGTGGVLGGMAPQSGTYAANLAAAGIDPKAVSAQVTQATGAGKKVIVTHLYDVDQAVDPAVTAATNIPYKQAGKLLADWVIVKTAGKANVLVTTINQVNSTVPMTEGIDEEFAAKCGAGCKVTKIDSTIADLGKLQQQVQSALTSDPTINYVINLYDSAQAPQSEAAIKALGRDDLKIATFNGTPDILKLITADSVIQMDVGENLEWIAYGAIDQHLRVLSGGEATTTPNIPIRVFDATNVAESTADGQGFGTAFRDEYKKLWGLK